MSIENPTLAHFRHFSSLYTNEYRVSRYESFLQNKPNFRNAQMNISSVKTMNYEQITTNNANKNKPNQTQFQTGPAISINNSSQHLPQNSAQDFVNLDILLLFGSKSLCPRSGPKKKHQNNDVGNQGNCQTYRH